MIEKVSKELKDKYRQDLPIYDVNWNWKLVKITMPENIYWDGVKRMGVLLHDGKFMFSGTLLNENEFVVIDEDPMELNKGGLDE